MNFSSFKGKFFAWLRAGSYICSARSHTASSCWTPPGPEGSKGRRS